MNWSRLSDRLWPSASPGAAASPDDLLRPPGWNGNHAVKGGSGGDPATNLGRNGIQTAGFREGHGGADLPEESVQATQSYALLKGLDVSFGIEASQAEREAEEMARAMAASGQPRHDLRPTGSIEAETLLVRRAAQVLNDWARRARGRLQEAARSASAEFFDATIGLDQHVSRYRYLIERLRIVHAEVVEAAAIDRDAERSRASLPKRSLSYQPMLGQWAFWPLIVLLVLADFVANLPVFHQLLPTSPQADAALRNYLENASASPMGFGLKSFLATAFVHLDASILALSAIILLVFCGDQLGSAARSVVALRGVDEWVDKALLGQHRRRPWAPLIASLLGVLLVIGVLFEARGRISEPTARRVAAAEQELSQLKGKSPALPPAQRQKHELAVVTLEEKLPALRDQARYAESIVGMNRPIALLNAALALCAALAAYLRRSEHLDLDPPMEKRSMAARARQAELRKEVDDVRASICRLESSGEAKAAQVRHFSSGSFFAEAGGKIDRINALIPLFRMYNATHRALDTRDILAFTVPPAPVRPDAELGVPLRLPEGFQDATSRFLELQREFRDLERERQSITEASA